MKHARQMSLAEGFSQGKKLATVTANENEHMAAPTAPEPKSMLATYIGLKYTISSQSAGVSGYF